MGKRLWQFDLRNRKLQTASRTATKVQLCDTYKEYIPEVTEHPHDHNTSTENEICHKILDPKTSASANINDPTYPGPHGKAFIYKRNLTLYLAQTKLPKAVYDSVSFAPSEILDLPPSYKHNAPKAGLDAPCGFRNSRARAPPFVARPSSPPVAGGGDCMCVPSSCVSHLVVFNALGVAPAA